MSAHPFDEQFKNYNRRNADIIKEWCLEHSQVDENMLVKKLRAHFVDSDIVRILEILDGTNSCCRRDE